MTVQNQGSPRRGRPRAYDPNLAMARAMAEFWRHGYSATSLDALSAATGMNRPSLYGAFGDKRTLYLAAMQRYIDGARTTMEATLTGAKPLRVEFKRVFDLALKLYFPADEQPRGCLLTGTAAAEAVDDADIRALLGHGLRELDRPFEARLRLAQVRGELPADRNAAVLARIASALLHSMALRARAGERRSELAATAAAGIELICGAA